MTMNKQVAELMRYFMKRKAVNQTKYRRSICLSQAEHSYKETEEYNKHEYAINTVHLQSSNRTGFPYENRSLTFNSPEWIRLT